MKLFLRPPEHRMEGRILGTRSKSVSNRLLIISALGGSLLERQKLSAADDTRELHRALSRPGTTHTLEGGTSFRFLLAYRFAVNEPVRLYPGGSMKGRPIGPLVDALEELGGQFKYLGEPGQAPIDFLGRSKEIQASTVGVDCSISSQFASALALISPALDRPITIELSDDISSRSYLDLTVQIMKQHGARINAKDLLITSKPSTYSIGSTEAEGDWSAASFFYALAALLPAADLFIPDLSAISQQPDRVISDWFEQWNVRTEFEKTGIRIRRGRKSIDPAKVSLDFNDNPDLSIPVFLFCALKNIPLQAAGVQSLPHKESDRLMELKRLLNTVRASLIQRDGMYHLKPSKAVPDFSGQSFHPAGDHRLAMGLSLFSTLYPIRIEDAQVVSKSYPNFWKDLEHTGFVVRAV